MINVKIYSTEVHVIRKDNVNNMNDVVIMRRHVLMKENSDSY